MYFNGYTTGLTMTFMLTYKQDLTAEEDTNRSTQREADSL